MQLVTYYFDGYDAGGEEWSGHPPGENLDCAFTGPSPYGTAAAAGDTCS